MKYDAVMATTKRGPVATMGAHTGAHVGNDILFLMARVHIIAKVKKDCNVRLFHQTCDADVIDTKMSLTVHLLVDKQTAIAAETFAVALQANHRALVVGTGDTFGNGRIKMCNR